MVFEINGLDMKPYIANQGLQWTREDLEGANAGRGSIDGTMYRDRRAIKYRFDITCRPLLDTELSLVLQAINPEYITVRFTDPLDLTVKTKTFYSNNVPASFLMRIGSKEYWSGLNFPVIER